MIVFKLDRERPAYTMHQNTLYYVKVKKGSIILHHIPCTCMFVGVSLHDSNTSMSVSDPDMRKCDFVTN